MEYPDTLRFGRSSWNVCVDGCLFKVRHSEMVSDAIGKALAWEFPQPDEAGLTHSWRLVHLKSETSRSMDTVLYVLMQTGSSDGAERLVADSRVQRVPPDRLVAMSST